MSSRWLGVVLIGVGVAAMAAGLAWRAGSQERLVGAPIVGLDRPSGMRALVELAATADGERMLQRVESRACPTGADASAAFFAPRDAVVGEVLDIESSYESADEVSVRHIGDLALPTGQLLESGGEYLGSGAGIEPQPVTVAEPGVYGFFQLVRGDLETGQPLFAQLVFDPDGVPVRWEADDRFGSGTDGALNWVGAPESSIDAFVTLDADLDRHTLDYNHVVYDVVYSGLFGQFQAQPGFCAWFDVAPPETKTSEGGVVSKAAWSSSVLFSNAYGDGWTPAAAGYDVDGELVAITWFLRSSSWVLAGDPWRAA